MRKSQAVFATQARYGIRNLANLEATASTARVLNLVEVSREWSETTEYHAAPLFRSRVLNTALYLKHRLRRDEAYMVACPTQVTTKIIVPLHRDQFGLGGQSLLIGQRGWREALLDLSGGEDGVDFLHDLNVLQIMNELPSFDPFLLREHLRRKNVNVAACYFAISAADVIRMRGFVAGEVSDLVHLTFGDLAARDLDQTARLVSTLLSTKIDAKLEPLRRTFGMDPETFREGVFSWKGFLYYKWAMADLTIRVNQVMAEIAELEVLRPCPYEIRDYIRLARVRIRRAIADNYRSVTQALAVYDDAFRDLTVNGEPRAFREFLIRAPAMFLSLGEKMGALGHIASFWRYRFPDGDPLKAPGVEAHEILRDFELSLGIHPEAGDGLDS
ncbi:hypothetical protein [Phenylobacterium aquaticum]|uniref:hypothetical protein n=1 Tax=Phenylobacterium aquaticum TaxID=1763816 RepID=UPI0026EDCA43|nr:hypothetical protein [Phenylobacterium aquaticum]